MRKKQFLFELLVGAVLLSLSLVFSKVALSFVAIIIMSVSLLTRFNVQPVLVVKNLWQTKT